MENLFKIMDNKKNNVEKFEEQNDRWNIRRFLLDKQKEEQKNNPTRGILRWNIILGYIPGRVAFD